MEVVPSPVPDLSLLGDVTVQGRVDAPEVPDALAVLGILAHAHVELVLPDHTGRDDLVGGAPSAEDVLGSRRVGVELPEQLARLRLEAVEPAVAPWKDDLGPTFHDGVGRVRPRAVEDLGARRVVLPHECARLHVEGDEARGGRRGDVDVAFVDAVAGRGEEQAVHHQRGADRKIVGEDVQLLDHVVFPDDVAVDRARLLLRRDRAVVAVAEALRVQAHDGGAVGGVEEPLALRVGRRANPLLRPVIDAPRRQLLMGHLPQERSVRGLERHHDASILGELRALEPVVVGADEHLPAEDHGARVGLRAHIGPPLDVLPGLDVPIRRQAGLGRHHVSREGVAEHGAVGGLGHDALGKAGGDGCSDGGENDGEEPDPIHSFTFTVMLSQ